MLGEKVSKEGRAISTTGVLYFPILHGRLVGG